jgi:hypothetical protein
MIDKRAIEIIRYCVNGCGGKRSAVRDLTNPNKFSLNKSGAME